MLGALTSDSVIRFGGTTAHMSPDRERSNLTSREMTSTEKTGMLKEIWSLAERVFEKDSVYVDVSYSRGMP